MGAIDLGSCQYDMVGEYLGRAIDEKMDIEDFANSLGYCLEYDDTRVDLDGYQECKNPAEFLLRLHRDSASDLWSAAYMVATDLLEFDLISNLYLNDVTGNSIWVGDDDKETAIYCYMLMVKGGVSSVEFFAGFCT